MSFGDGDSGTALMEAGPRQLQTAAQQLPPDLMLLKMENESIMQVARIAPREPMKIVAQLRELIEAYPAAAENAIYCKPVGTVTQVTCANPKCGIKYEVTKVDNDTQCPNCEGKKRGECRPIKKFAEGLSIRAAESIRSIFGYTRLSTTCEILKDGSARLTGVLVDYAAGNMTSDERIVPRSYKAKSGQMVTIAEDRFMGVTVKAEKAKLMRDVILMSTPGIVKAMFRDMCEQKMVDLVSPELIEQKVVPAFADYGISREMLDKIIGRPMSLGWREQERLQARKILTSLKNEETTVAELLSDFDVPPPALPTAKSAPQTTAELAEQMKGKQSTQQPAPESQTESVKQPEAAKEPPKEAVTFDLAALAPRFAACKSYTQVSELMKEIRPTIPPDQKDAVSELEDNARHRISVDLEAAKKKK